MQVIMAVTSAFRKGCTHQVACHFQKLAQHAVQMSRLMLSQMILTIFDSIFFSICGHGY